MSNLPLPLLSSSDPDPVLARRLGAASPFVMIADHAGHAVPESLGTLGLPMEELTRHIGWDIGILGVSERASEVLGATFVAQRYSRLVVECNRQASSPDFVTPVSDGTRVPANQGIDAGERARRAAAIVEPYHQAIAAELDARLAAGRPPILVAMHSFTPSLRARPGRRPWHVGLCYAGSDAFSRAVIAILERDAALVVGRNEPYGVDLARDYSVPLHAEARGLPYAAFEIRQDLIADAQGQAEWGDRVASCLAAALELFSAEPRLRDVGP